MKPVLENFFSNAVKYTEKGSVGIRAKKMVRSAGGKIKFDSQEGKGTTFYVTLPLSGMKKKTQQSLI